MNFKPGKLKAVIFAGPPKDWAELKFSQARSGWVQHEIWHPEQVASFNPDESYTLRLPYSDERELLGDILRFGADVEVVQPLHLRKLVAAQLSKMVGLYGL